MSYKLRFIIWAFLSIALGCNIQAQQNISDSTRTSKLKQFDTKGSKHKSNVKSMTKIDANPLKNTSKIKPSNMATANKIDTPIKTAEKLSFEIEVLKAQIITAQENSFYSEEYIEKLKYALFLKVKQLKEFHPQIKE